VSHNPAIGRFLSVDPLAKEFSTLTPYQYAGNNPIYHIEVEGAYFTGSTELINRIEAKLRHIDSEEARAFLQTIDRLRNSEIEFNILGTVLPQADGVGGELYFDTEENRVVVDVYRFTQGGEHKFSEEARGIHELEHARQFLDSELDFLTPKSKKKKKRRYASGGFSYDQTDELKAFEAQNIIGNTELEIDEKPLIPEEKVKEYYNTLTPLDKRTSEERTPIYEGVAKKEGRKYFSVHNYNPSEEQVKGFNESKNNNRE
jgi:hypothetical protein